MSNAPDEGGNLTFGLPAWTYSSETLMRLEYERLILPSWQFACHVNQVKDPGDFTTFDMTFDSIIVIRDRQGDLRAFKNVCRHRGARLLDGEGKCPGRIVCPYHGWSYGYDGALKGVAAEKTFPGLDKDDFGLDEVELEVMMGLVFIRVVPGGPSLKDIWGDYVDYLAPYRLEEQELIEVVDTEVWNCNWKIAIDNNLENYHVPIGHPGYHRMLDNELLGFMNDHGVAGSRSVLRDRPSSNPTERMYQKMAPEVLTDLPEETRRTWFFFSMPPNIGIDIYPDCFDIFQAFPVTPTTCRLRYPVFGPKDERREARVLRYLNSRINWQVTKEDRELCERVQEGMMSHGYEPGPLSQYEVSVIDFHNRIRAAIPEVNEASEPEDFKRPPISYAAD